MKVERKCRKKHKSAPRGHKSHYFGEVLIVIIIVIRVINTKTAPRWLGGNQPHAWCMKKKLYGHFPFEKTFANCQ